MLDFWNSVIGILMIIAGISAFVWLTNRRIKGDKGGYGNHIEMYTGAILMLMAGLTLLVRELMKL